MMELLEKARQQEALKHELLILVASAVSDLLADTADEWSETRWRQANEIDDLARKLKTLSAHDGHHE
jgi:hypothetical protein